MEIIKPSVQERLEALRFAVAATSLAAESYGSQPDYTDRVTIENKLADFNK